MCCCCFFIILLAATCAAKWNALYKQQTCLFNQTGDISLRIQFANQLTQIWQQWIILMCAVVAWHRTEPGRWRIDVLCWMLAARSVWNQHCQSAIHSLVDSACLQFLSLFLFDYRDSFRSTETITAAHWSIARSVGRSVGCLDDCNYRSTVIDLNAQPLNRLLCSSTVVVQRQ